jgi:CRISPR/Cas system-associated protein Csx1
VEVRINNVDEKALEYNETTFKTFNVVKDQISKIIKSIEEDKQKYESSYENRTQYLRMLEFKILERFDGELQV